eukprot:5070538-Amphidinium_carterae.1
MKPTWDVCDTFGGTVFDFEGLESRADNGPTSTLPPRVKAGKHSYVQCGRSSRALGSNGFRKSMFISNGHG